MKMTPEFIDRLKKHLQADDVIVKEHSWHFRITTKFNVNGAPVETHTTAVKTADETDVMNLVARNVAARRDEALATAPAIAADVDAIAHKQE